MVLDADSAVWSHLSVGVTAPVSGWSWHGVTAASPACRAPSCSAARRCRSRSAVAGLASSKSASGRSSLT